MTQRRGVGSGAAGIVVLLAMLIGWWLFSGNGPGGPPGSASRMVEPSSAPLSPTATTTALETVPRGLTLVSWAQDGTTLRLTYRRGEDDCFGSLATPRVDESDVAVTITLLHEPPQGATADCPFTTTGEVDVDLDAVVGDRSVLDGSYVGRRVRVAPPG